MKSNPVIQESLVKRWSHFPRLAVALGAMALGLGTASAQSVAITTLAGTALNSGSVDGTGAAARFFNPQGIAVDGSGNVYVADSANHVIRRIVAATGVVTTIVGSPGASGSANGVGSVARFNAPQGLAISGTTLFVADTFNHAIRQVDLSTNTVTTLAGTAGTQGDANGTGVAALFRSPIGLVVSGANLYAADTGNHSVRQIVIATGVVTTFAGTSGASGTADGTGAAARFANPGGITADALNLYVADTANHTIRRIVLASGAVTTIAGTAATQGSTDATGAAALFRSPGGIVADASGTNLYVADTNNHTLRRLVVSSAAVTTIAGSAQLTGTADGVGTAARFQGPYGIAIDGAGVLFIADVNNQTIRRGAAAVAPGVTNPSNVTAALGASANFTVAVTGNPTPTVQWQRQPAGTSGFSDIAAGGAYSGVTGLTLTVNPLTAIMSGDQFRAVATNAVLPAATSSAATLTVTQPPVFSSAASTSFSTAAAGTFTVTATGSPAPTFSLVAGTFPPWASLNGTTGVISGTPPNTTGSPFAFTIRATNTAGTADQSFTLTVLPPSSVPVITAHPANFNVPVGSNTASFSVTASANPAITGYQWQLRNADNTFSNVSDGGIYGGSTTASLSVSSISSGMNGSVFRVLVSNSIGTTTSGEATLTVIQAPNFTNTSSATFVTNQSNTFTFAATGVPAPTFSTSSTLPSGVTLNSTSGVLSGSPSSTTGTPFALVVTATNTGGSATQNFTLNVSAAGAAAAIATQPAAVTAQLGATATFTASATGNPTPSLRWQRQPSGTTGFVDLFDDGTYSGTTTGTLTILNVAAGMTGDQIRLVATNTVDGTPHQATSNIVALTVNIGTTITTFAGTAGLAGSTDGTGAAARFNTPASIAADVFGNFYVADAANHIIRKITASGVVTTLAGQAGASGNTDGAGSVARFNGPSAITVDSVGNVYVADTYNQTIRAISAAGNVTTLAGLANNSGSADGTGSAARFAFPSGIAVDLSGNIYVADSSNHTIRRVTTAGVVTTFAGTAGSPGSTNGTGAAARFNTPIGLAIGSGGVVFVADSFNHVIRRISVVGEVTTIAGTAGSAGSADGNGSAARFNQPNGVGVDSAGNVYVADTFSHTIRRISTANDVTTLAGSVGVAGSTDGVGSAARFNQPFAVAVDSNSNLYIVDTRNSTIRRSGTTSAPVISTHPQNRAVPVGGTATLSVVASATPSPSYQWQRQAAGTFGFVNLTNDAVYSGVSTATLSVANVSTVNTGDQYRVIVTNGINPSATSEVATLTIGEAPVITSAGLATARATEAFSFTFTATGSPAPTFSASGLPTGLTLNSTTGVLSGTPPAGSEGQYTVTVTASNGINVNQSFVLTIQPAVIAPTISAQPASLAVDQGQSATFSVTASGTAPLTYQWRRNGAVIAGAVTASYTVGNAQTASAGSYTVTVSNAAGSVTSAAAQLVVNTPPVFTSQPQTQVALAGSNVTFSVSATGGSGFSYQWRKNGVAIVGATNATFNLTAVTASDAANYDVIVTNPLGSFISSLAQLTVTTTASAPVITARPADRTVVVGGTTTLTVGATGAPAPTYQWRKNGANIGGATNASLTLTNLQTIDGGNYDVVVSNGSGSVTSSPATGLRVVPRSYQGIYFGSFGGGLGSFAMFVRENNTAVFLGYLPGSTAPVTNHDITIGDTGSFAFTQGAIASASSVEGEPARAAALGSVTVVCTIGVDGTLSGNIVGGANTTLSATRSADTGTAQSVAGFYQGGAASGAATVQTIAAANGQAFVLVQSGAASDGGVGTVTSAGQVSLVTNRSVITQAIATTTGTLTGTATGAVAASFNGASESALSLQRLVNISSRARVASGDSVAIAGFIISGDNSKPVLIRAVGPTLSGAPFNVSGALATPRLELFRGSTSIAVNTGIAANRAAIDAAGVQAGAFALGASGADAAILTTLAPGAYTAIVSGTTATAAGVALVEVYDLSAPAVGQKLLNIATRASAGTGDNTLIAGFVVPNGAPKRVLIRGVGPGLAQFGVAGVLAQPTLLLLSGSTTIAQNTNWSTSASAAAITTSSAQVGAFGLANNDSALIATLNPGSYTAQVVGAGTSTGVALIEVYELP